MILIKGLKIWVKDIHDDMSNGKSGTGTALFVKSQTGLIAGIAASDLTLSNKTFTTSQVTANHVIGTGTANSNTLAEFEINNGSISYNRAVKAGTLKTSSIEMTIIHTFDCELI